MKTLLAKCSIVALLTGGPATFTFAQTAKDDMKDAGHETKQAAKDTGKATKKTAKKVKNKTKKTVNKGAAKVEQKTQP